MMNDPANLARMMTESGTRVDAEQLSSVSRLIQKQPKDHQEDLMGALGLDGVMPTLNTRHLKRTAVAGSK